MAIPSGASLVACRWRSLRRRSLAELAPQHLSACPLRQFIDEENTNGNALSALLATADLPANRGQARFRLAQAQIMLNRRGLNYAYFFTRFDELGIRPDYGQQTIHIDPADLCKPLIVAIR